MDRGASSAKDSTIRRSENPTRQDGRPAIQDATLGRQGGTPASMGKNSPAKSNPQSTIDVQSPHGSNESLHSTVKELQDEVQQLRSEVRNIGGSVGEGGVLHLRQPVTAFFSWLSPRGQKGAAEPDETQEHHARKPPKGFESGGEPNEDVQESWTKLKSENQKLFSDSDKLSTKNRDLLLENQKLLLDSKKLSTRNRDLLSENQNLLSDSGKLSTKNRDLQSENHRLSTELHRADVQYQALHNEHATHRCADSDDLEVSDREIEDKFRELQATIESLFSKCNAEGLKAVVVQDMSKKCRATMGLDWWEFMEADARESWLASLLANVLHSEFFKTPFFLLSEAQREFGLVDFEELIFDESSGISRQQATEWRARTFRIAEVLSRRTQPPKPEGAARRLLGIFKPILTNKEALSEICGLALNCAALLRKSKSRYFWEQWAQPVNATKETATIRRISRIDESKGPKLNIIFNVFGGVVKESRNPAEKKYVILKPVVAISKGYSTGAR